MAQVLYHKKDVTGFTLIELGLSVMIFSLLLGTLLDLTTRTYQFHRKIQQVADLSGELRRLNAQVTKRITLASSVHVPPDNHGIRYVTAGREASLFFREGALWENAGGTSRRIPAAHPLEDFSVIAEDGYLLGRLQMADKVEYFEVKLP